jgi:RHS repeat-associated protein
MTASYTYNGDGLRASRKVGRTTTKFVYDTAEGLPLVLGDGASFYLYGPDGVPFEQVTTAGVVTYLDADQLGWIRMLTDLTGKSVGTATYTAYGTRTTTGTTSAFEYAGQYTDSETGLQSLRARYYDPTTAQFLTVDPLAAGAGYAYAGGNPITGTDPTGLCDWSNVGGCLLAGASAWVATHTVGVCVTGAAGFGGFVSGTRCVVISGGALAITKTVGVGGSTPTASLSTGFVLSNARKSDQLAGWFYGGGASVDVGPSAGDDFVVGKDSCGAKIWTNDLHVGVGIDGVPVERHLNATYTQVETW